MKKLMLLMALCTVSLLFSECASSYKVGKPKFPSRPVSYEKDLFPIMQVSCSPCHFPTSGRRDMLNTYEATREHIGDIVRRTEKKPGSLGYMPYKEKRPGLTPEEVDLFRQWVQQKMPR